MDSTVGGRLLIVNGTVVSPGQEPARADVRIRAGRIASVIPPLADGDPYAAPSDLAIAGQSGDVVLVDARDCFVAPGFIDVHVHGGAGQDFMDATPDALRLICRFHGAGGTTGLLATSAAASADELQAMMGSAADVQQESPGGAAILGVHLEGPYFAPTKHGCHLPGQVRPPDLQECIRLLDAYPGLVKWMTLAPELEGALPLIRELARRGAVASAGHTEATEPQIMAAIRAGLRHATHLYCAMSTITKDGPRRIPGLVETALARDELTTEVIADGHHLAPTLLRIAARAKGPERLLLVTDAMRGAGMPDGTYTFGPKHGSEAIVSGGVARTPDNTGFASSTVRAHQLVRTMVEQADCSLVDAVTMASLAPARALGLDERKGYVRAGWDADLVVLDRWLNVRCTIVAGRIVFDATAGGSAIG